MAKDIELECKINDIKQVPNTHIHIISVHYKQGSKEWDKAFRFTPTKPVSMEWLEREIAKLDPWPEEDLMQNVMEEYGKKQFKIKVPEAEKSQTTEALVNQEANIELQQQQIAKAPGSLLE